MPIQLDLEVRREVMKEKVRTAWAWKRANWLKYEEEMRGECEQVQSEVSLKERVRSFTKAIGEAAKESIPRKKVSERNLPFWDEIRGVSAEQLRERKEKHAVLKRRIVAKNKSYWEKFVGEMKWEV